MNDIVDSMIEVGLDEPDDFLKVKETLTRIGVASRKDNKLFQSCHILHKQGKYYIVHFKELFMLDGKPSDVVETVVFRRNTIINLLVEWGLVTLVRGNIEDTVPLNQIKILSYSEKDEWDLVPKYNIGKK